MTGAIEAKASPNRANTLDLTITGAAAQDISAQLTTNGIKMERDAFSGAMVQTATGIRCIDGDQGQTLYCYVALVGAAVQ